MNRAVEPVRSSYGSIMHTLALVFGLCGCSLFVTPPTHAEVAAHEATDCTASPALPIVDTVTGLVGVVGGGVMVAKTRPNQEFGSIDEGVGTALVVVGVLYALSAVHGFSAVSDCRDLASTDRSAWRLVTRPRS